MDGRLQRQNRSYSAHGNHSLLQNAQFPTQHIHGPSQITKIKNELQELSNGEIATSSKAATVPEYGNKTETDEELEQRVQQAGQSCVPEIAADILPAHLAEILKFSILLRVCPDRPRRPQRFLCPCRDPSKRLLDFFKAGLHSLLEDQGGNNDQQQGGKGQQSEPP